jgi:uncharacterized protein YggL (DUF469 family)
MSSACPEYGFEFSFRLAPDAAHDASDVVWSAFIEAVEGQGLSAGGGGDVQWHHVISRDGAQATDADREWLLAWARRRADVAEAAAGPLIDLNVRSK